MSCRQAARLFFQSDRRAYVSRTDGVGPIHDEVHVAAPRVTTTSAKKLMLNYMSLSLSFFSSALELTVWKTLNGQLHSELLDSFIPLVIKKKREELTISMHVEEVLVALNY